jgi:hypothetical protein
MTRRSCARELEIAEAMLSAGGTAALPQECRLHLESCGECRDLIEVIAMLRDEHARTANDVSVPAAGQVWWRAAVRARLEEAQAAARPVTWAQGVTGATLFGVTCAAVILSWPAVRRLASLVWVRWEDGWDASALATVPPTLAAVEHGLPLVLGVIAAVVVMPLAVLYFALAGED